MSPFSPESSDRATLPKSAPWPRAVLFDHDGVLVESEPLQSSAWGKLLQELGLPYDPKDFQIRVGKTAPEILKDLYQLYRPEEDFTKLPVEALCTRKNDFYLALLSGAATGGLRAYPGVRVGLEWLRAQGIRTAVVSNARSRELRAGLAAVGIDSLFDVILSRDETRIPKPDPTPYLMAAAELGFEPSECLAVEDSPAGIEAALRGAIPAAAILTNFSRETMALPVLGRPDLRPWRVFESIEGLFTELRALRGSD